MCMCRGAVLDISDSLPDIWLRLPDIGLGLPEIWPRFSDILPEFTDNFAFSRVTLKSSFKGTVCRFKHLRSCLGHHLGQFKISVVLIASLMSFFPIIQNSSEKLERKF